MSSSSEKNNSHNLEHGERGKEELEKIGLEVHEKLRETQRENAGEKHQENAHEARQEALESAISAKQEHIGEIRETSPTERRHGPVGKIELSASFDNTMHEVQNQMSSSSRAFSKVIHNKAIEKISDTVANSVARPNALLSGAVLAFALTLGVYLVAKNLGYTLSGFETIGAFVVGWVIGLAYDFLKVMITGRE
jgi:hypothetical protein